MRSTKKSLSIEDTCKRDSNDGLFLEIAPSCENKEKLKKNIKRKARQNALQK
jgi:hypothetical protein